MPRDQLAYFGLSLRAFRLHPPKLESHELGRPFGDGPRDGPAVIFQQILFLFAWAESGHLEGANHEA